MNRHIKYFDQSLPVANNRYDWMCTAFGKVTDN